MKTLGIDLETYSDAPIKDCGSFRYIDDPSFEILLFAYSVDGAPAVVVDFTAGEAIPSAVYHALWDPAVTKTGWNNAFERYALWKAFGHYCPPEEWEDTMVLAASCGLPLKLETCCEALQMGEDKAKLRIGSALIREFCCPQKRPLKKWNMAKRITPSMDPENWELFKQYNDGLKQLEELIIRINLTNSKSKVDGVTLTELIARRDVLKQKIDAYRSVLASASSNTSRATRTEIKVLSTINVESFQKDVDRMSKELRELDNKIQEANWKIELM